MWECKKCGQENDNSFPHCMSCGVERRDAPPEPAESADAVRPRYRPEARSAVPSDWDLTRTIARVVSFLGWVVLIIGLVAAPIMLIVVETRSDRMGEFLLAVAAQTLGAALTGLVLVLIGHVARAVVDTTENSGRMLDIMKSECGNPPDRAE